MFTFSKEDLIDSLCIEKGSVYKHIREMGRQARKNNEKAKIVVENISKVKSTHRFFFNSTVLSIQHVKPNVT